MRWSECFSSWPHYKLALITAQHQETTSGKCKLNQCMTLTITVIYTIVIDLYILSTGTSTINCI